MFNAYEALKCGICGKAFMGRKPIDGANILCPDCVQNFELPVIDVGDAIPSSVEKEVEIGGGDGGQN